MATENLTARLAKLSPAKRALFELRLKDKTLESSVIPSIRRRSTRDSAPLSFAQERLWFLNQLAPENPTYHESNAVRLAGILHLDALQNTLNEIVLRHEVLRTTIVAVNGNPFQVIAPNRHVDVPVIDLRAVPKTDRDSHAQRLIAETIRKPFDLSHDLMLRVLLLQLADQEHILLVVKHHIGSDGWSSGILWQELTALYRAFASGQPSPLDELPIQYADYAVWQRQWLQGEVLESHLSYWKKQLEGIPDVLNFPTDRPRPAVQSFRGKRESIELSRELTEGLKALSRREGVTLFMTLLAVFQTLLYRYTGQKDIVVGSPIANRNRAEIEGLIGFFVNTLVLRANFADDPTFKELLARVREMTLGAYEHQDLPFEKLVEVLRPKRSASHRSLIQVAFAFQNMPRQPLTFHGLTATPVHVDSETAKLDLTLFMRETEDGLAGVLNYNSDLYDSDRIRRVLEDFQSLVAAVVADPEKRIRELPPLAEPMVSTKTFDAPGGDKLNPYDNSNLTKNQLLIWAGQKLEPGVPLYNTPHTFTIHGEVDPLHFQNAFETLVNSSDALRTVIRESDGSPQQSVRPDPYDQLEHLDFSKHADARAALESWLQSRCRISFDFAERLFDSALIKLQEKRFVFYLNVHHIITDAVSRVIIFRWVSELYGRSVAGTLPERIELPRFGDYIGYEQEYRRSQRYQNAENYWKRKLAEKTEPIAFYGKRPATRSSRMNRVTCHLGVERTEKLKLLAVRKEIAGVTENASAFNVFAALLVTYLYRITGVCRHVIGSPIHNRKSRAFRDTIGLFMEVLPLEVVVGEHDTFLSVVNKVKAEASEVFRFSHTIGNSPQRKAYDVMLNFSTVAYPTFHNMPVEVKGLPTAPESHSLALQIHDFDNSGSFVIDFDFHSDVFDLGQCSQAVSHFLQILDAFLEEPNQSVDGPSLLTTEERRHLAVEFNQTQATFPEPHVLPLLFEAQAGKTPNRPAIIYEDQLLTYAQLNSCANQVAHYLNSLGVGLESIVALCVEPSWQAIVGILGILKAGAAYLPVDPHYPKERLAFMLEDSQTSVLLTQRKLLEQDPELSQIIRPKGHGEGDASARGTLKGQPPNHPSNLICLDADWPRIGAGSNRNPRVPITSQNLAYIIYTSGSTGTAKGVMVSHEGVCNRLLWEQKVYPFSAADRTLQRSSLAFDTSVLEIFRPLLLGGATAIARPGDRQDCRYLVELIGKHRVSVAEFVPSMLELVADEEGIEKCASLKYVFSGGEVLSSQIQERFLGRTSSVLYNTYGPTEASIDVTHWNCVRDGQQGIVPIGRPIANTEIYILDRQANPVPVGVAGELHIGGAALARGYLNRPELTAEKFIPNPFSDELGARLYKTGDVARYLADGNIEFVGRLDHQVKIRGFRIELDEIEAVLRQHPNVQQAIVLAREEVENPKSETCTEPGRGIQNLKSDKRLVAYVVSRQEPTLITQDLRSFLKQKLPEYMVPSAFVFLDSLPLTPNGKVNQQTLPLPDGSRPELTATFVAPRNSTEETLAEIWSKLLNLNRVGIRDNFFDIGGHSLLAVRLFAEIEKTFKTRPPLSSLFQEPTIEHLATLISQENPTATPASLVAIQPKGSKLPFFCVHEFFGDVFCYLNLARHLGQDQPFYALEPRGLNGAGEALTDVAAMAAYYVKTIRNVQPHGPYALGGLCFGGVIAFEMAQQLKANGESVSMVALLDSGIKGGSNIVTRWWRRFESVSKGLPSWLAGASELNGSQWKDLIKLKHSIVKAKFGSRNGNSHASKLIDEMANLFGFSERHRKVAHAQHRAMRKYRPKVYPGQLTLFRARMQPLFSSHRPDKGWSRVAGGGLDIKVVPGNHLGMLQEPHVQILAAQLKTCLKEAHGRKVPLSHSHITEHERSLQI